MPLSTRCRVFQIIMEVTVTVVVNNVYHLQRTFSVSSRRQGNNARATSSSLTVIEKSMEKRVLYAQTLPHPNYTLPTLKQHNPLMQRPNELSRFYPTITGRKITLRPMDLQTKGSVQ